MVTRVSGSKCDVALLDNESDALDTVSRLGGDRSKPEPTPLRKLNDVLMADAQDLCNEWAPAPWEALWEYPSTLCSSKQPPAQQTAEATAPAAAEARARRVAPLQGASPSTALEAMEGGTAAFRVVKQRWDEWLDLERSRHSFNATLRTGSVEVPKLALNKRSLSFGGPNDRRQAQRRAKLAARCAAAPWNAGEPLQWEENFDVDRLLSPGRREIMSKRGVGAASARVSARMS